MWVEVEEQLTTSAFMDVPLSFYYSVRETPHQTSATAHEAEKLAQETISTVLGRQWDPVDAHSQTQSHRFQQTRDRYSDEPHPPDPQCQQLRVSCRLFRPEESPVLVQDNAQPKSQWHHGQRLRWLAEATDLGTWLSNPCSQSSLVVSRHSGTSLDGRASAHTAV